MCCLSSPQPPAALTSAGARVVFMDDTGGSKAIEAARALKKLGGRRAFVLSGGFNGWVASGLNTSNVYATGGVDALVADFQDTYTEVAQVTQSALSEFVDTALTPENLGKTSLAVGAVTLAIINWELALQEAALVGITGTVVSKVTSYKSSEELLEDIAGSAKAVVGAAGKAAGAASGAAAAAASAASAASSAAAKTSQLAASAAAKAKGSDSE